MKNRNHVHDLEVGEETRATKPVLTGLLVGGLIGAATALLFAPRSGEETRAELRGKAMEIRDRTTETVKDTVEQAKVKAYELKDNVVEKADELRHRGKRVANEQLDRASEVVEAGRKTVQDY
ncbi:MAG: YtxH domain-containing protein [Chloroflexota bacterium]